MKPACFDYVAPATLSEAVSLLEKHEGEAKVLAGGQSLMPLLTMRLARPSVLIDLNKITELDYIRESNGSLAIGAMTRKRAVEQSALVKSRQPMLHAATRLVAHTQIRNRGTVGGSLAHADPAAEYPAVAYALDAELCSIGPSGSRTIPAAEFFVTYLTTVLEPCELLSEVRFPVLAERTGWSFDEIARRRGDFAMAGVATTVTLESDGHCSAARVVVFGVAPTPFRARQTEEALIGERPDEALLERAAEQATDEIEEPLSDIHASAPYRRSLAQVLTRRGLAEAVARAGEAA
jgi:carbon-monoxide dehydrogenase medium subunit